MSIETSIDQKTGYPFAEWYNLLMFGHLKVQISAKDLHDRLKSANPPRLLDVREESELREGRIKDCLHIRLAELERRLPELDPRISWVVYCHSGFRSLQAAMFLKKKGFSDVKTLSGGIGSFVRVADPHFII